MGEGSPVTLDLTHGYNRVVDSWYSLFSGEVQQHMPAPGCVYPGNLTEEERYQIVSEARPEWHELRWHQKAVPTDTIWLTRRIFVEIQWDLKVRWQGLTWENDGTTYEFLENITPYVELTEASQSLSLTVSGSFGTPSLYGGANLPVNFHILVSDGSTRIRDEMRSFQIYADGRRQRI